MIRNENFRIAIISTIVLLVTSFMPVIQMTYFNLNNVVVYYLIPIDIEFKAQNLAVVNALLTICTLFFLLLSKELWLKICLTVISTFFLIPFFIQLSDNIPDHYVNLDSSLKFSLSLLIIGSLVGLILIMTMALKNKIERRNTITGPTTKSSS